MRLPAEILVLVCLIVGIAPSVTVGPARCACVRARRGPPAYSLAAWHGFTPELLMSVVALGGGVAVYFMLRPYLLRGSTVRPCCATQWPAHFRPVLVFLSWRLARWLEGILGTRRLQPQLQLLAGRRSPPPWHRFMRGARHWGLAGKRSQPRLHSSGRSESPARSAPPTMAKFHRLAALILLGGAGPCHLHQLRMAVGARPRSHAACRGDRDHGATSPRPALAPKRIEQAGSEGRWRT